MTDNFNKRFVIYSHILIVFFAIIVYSNSFDCSFHYDDLRVIVVNKALHTFYDANSVWEWDKGRFLTGLTFAANYYYSGVNVFYYHAVNLLIHVLCAISIFWLIINIFKTPALKDKGEISRNSNFIALLTALIFTVHPIQTQAVTYIVQRYEIMASLFYILTVLFYIKARLSKNSFVYLFYPISLISMVLSNFCKEISLSIPLMIIAVEFLFFSLSLKETLKNWKILLPFIVMGFLPLLLIGKLDVLEIKSEEQLSPYIYFLTSCKVIITYIRLLFLPINQNVDYDYSASKGLFEAMTLVSILFSTLLLAVSIRLLKINRLYTFCIWWYYIVLSVTTSFLPIADVINEHRLYLAVLAFGLSIVISSFYIFKKFKGKVWLIIPIILIIIFSFTAYKRNFVWKSELTLWEDALKKSPNKARVLNNIGLQYALVGRFKEAHDLFKKSIQIKSTYVISLNNMGTCLSSMGEYDQAITYFERAIEAESFNTEYHNNMGLAYMNKGELDKAMECFKRAVGVDDSNYYAHNNIARIYEQRGDYNEAIFEYKTALKYNTEESDVYLNLGNVYLKTKNYLEARTCYNNALNIDSENAVVYNSLGILYDMQGKNDEARDNFEKAVLINPYLYDAHSNLGWLYLVKLKNKDEALHHFRAYLRYKPQKVEAKVIEEIVKKLESEKF